MNNLCLTLAPVDEEPANTKMAPPDEANPHSFLAVGGVLITLALSISVHSIVIGSNWCRSPRITAQARGKYVRYVASTQLDQSKVDVSGNSQIGR